MRRGGLSPTAVPFVSASLSPPTSCAFGTVYRSDDEGRSWRPFNTGLPSAPGMHGSLHEGPDGHLYFALSGKGIYRTKAPIRSGTPTSRKAAASQPTAA